MYVRTLGRGMASRMSAAERKDIRSAVEKEHKVQSCRRLQSLETEPLKLAVMACEELTPGQTERCEATVPSCGGTAVWRLGIGP